MNVLTDRYTDRQTDRIHVHHIYVGLIQARPNYLMHKLCYEVWQINYLLLIVGMHPDDYMFHIHTSKLEQNLSFPSLVLATSHLSQQTMVESWSSYIWKFKATPNWFPEIAQFHRWD